MSKIVVAMVTNRAAAETISQKAKQSPSFFAVEGDLVSNYLVAQVGMSAYCPRFVCWSRRELFVERQRNRRRGKEVLRRICYVLEAVCERRMVR